MPLLKGEDQTVQRVTLTLNPKESSLCKVPLEKDKSVAATTEDDVVYFWLV